MKVFNYLGVIGTLSAAMLAGSVNAASFNFEYTFDGTTIMQNAGSDTANGTALVVGDDFTIDVSATVGEFWTVVNPYNVFVPLSYAVSESNIRTASITTQWLLNGIVQDSQVEVANQSSVHVGAQSWGLAAGLMFDQVIVDWTFDAIDTAGATTISAGSADFFTGFGQPGLAPFFRADDIKFSAAVPVPAAVWLFGSGLLGMIGIGRRKKAN